MQPHLAANLAVLEELYHDLTAFLCPLDESCLNWTPPIADTNSIAALVMHVVGSNLSWFSRAVDEPFARDRNAEFGAHADADALTAMLADSLADIRAWCARLEAVDLSATRAVYRLGTAHETPLSAAWCIKHAIIHTGEHWGQMQLNRQLYAAAAHAAHAADTAHESAAGALPNFSWLIANELAGMGRSRTAADLATVRARGVRAVISLTEEPLPAAWVAAARLDILHVPVADFTAPTPAQIALVIAAMDAYHAAGLPVVVHCAGGRGRTGTLLACALVARGESAVDAIAAVRAARPGSIETAEQEAAIAAYAAMLRAVAGAEAEAEAEAEAR